ncbi:hypothetical protein EPN52_03690 [bacterium]|nr:MAG: hypothetical protein EPN52_03690 [bacterium]
MAAKKETVFHYKEHSVKNIAGAAGLALLLGLAGCSNFNYPVGVQQFGSVTGTLIDTTTQQPIGGAGANVQCGGQATHPDQSGGFTIGGIAIGVVSCAINAVGYQYAQIDNVTITAGNTTQLGLVKLTPTLRAGG